MNWPFVVAFVVDILLWIAAYLSIHRMVEAGIMPEATALVVTFLFGVALGWIIRSPPEPPIGA